MNWEGLTWEEAYAMVRIPRSDIEPETICAAIARLGKPYDENRIRQAAPLVAACLRHDSFLVRYQAIWFLGSWARLAEYLPSVIEAAQSDANPDNRAFAARCAGQILKSIHNAYASEVLLRLATTESEEAEVRAAAYGSLLFAYFGETAEQDAREFDPMGSKGIQDFDLQWLGTLNEWIKQLEDTQSAQGNIAHRKDPRSST